MSGVKETVFLEYSTSLAKLEDKIYLGIYTLSFCVLAQTIGSIYWKLVSQYIFNV